MDPLHHLSLCWLPLKAGNLLTPSAWALSSRPLSYPLPYCKEGLVKFTRRTSAQAVPICVRVLTAPPTLYLKSRCGPNRHALACFPQTSKQAPPDWLWRLKTRLPRRTNHHLSLHMHHGLVCLACGRAFSELKLNHILVSKRFFNS